MDSITNLPIGIDLGTTNSAMAVFENGAVNILKDRCGETLVPSVVALDRSSDALLIGRPAKELLALAPDRAASVFKRSMGQDSQYKFGNRKLSAVELSACVLRSLREDGSSQLERDVSQCVITVPAYFNQEQRFATIKAGELAGFEVLRILNEPTAAAMAYGLHKRDKDCQFLVFDLGGGTFDVCIMERFAGVLQVKSTAGESYLGGEDFTRTLMNAVLEEVGMAFEVIEAKDQEALGILLKRCELAKRRLSTEDEVEIMIPCIKNMLSNEVPFNIDRETVEKIWEPLVQRLLSPCRAAMRGAGTGINDLDEIILVGGATRMPCVRNFVRSLFDKKPASEIDPDLAVVHGASIQAALCARNEAVEDLVVTDVLSHSLGVDVSKKLGGKYVSGYFSPIIHRNTVIPTSRTETYSTIEPNQTVLLFRIFEGESRLVEENKLIGKLKLKGIPKGPAGQEVNVRFTYDLNGVLEVEATVPETGKSISQVFSRETKSLSPSELENAKKRIARLKADPNDDPKIRDLLLRAESLWREIDPVARRQLDEAIDALKSEIEMRNPSGIQEAFKVLLKVCDLIDGGDRW